MLSNWRYRLLALLLMLFVLASLATPSRVHSEKNIEIQYSLRLYQDITALYSNKPLLSGTVKATFEEKGSKFQASMLSLVIKKESLFASLTKGSLVRIIEAPSIKHFVIDPQLLQECRKKDVLKTGDGWELVYIGKSAIAMSDNRMEEGYSLLLTFKGGSKEVLYDDDTGILLSEMFYIKTGFGQAYVITLNVANGPSFIGDEGIPLQNVFLLEATALVIFFLSIIAVVLRRRYRIL